MASIFKYSSRIISWPSQKVVIITFPTQMATLGFGLLSYRPFDFKVKVMGLNVVHIHKLYPICYFLMPALEMLAHFCFALRFYYCRILFQMQFFGKNPFNLSYLASSDWTTCLLSIIRSAGMIYFYISLLSVILGKGFVWTPFAMFIFHSHVNRHLHNMKEQSSSVLPLSRYIDIFFFR